MSSVIRSRGGGSKAESHPSSEPTVILDEAQQESLVRELEGQATKAAALWRAVFGGGSGIIGVYFLVLAAAMALSPKGSTDVWHGVRVRNCTPCTCYSRRRTKRIQKNENEI